MDLITTARIAELEDAITKARDAYYNKKPVMSDSAFDALEDELRSLDPGHALLSTVGAAPSASSDRKVRHGQPMGSLDKENTWDEVTDWWARKCGARKGKLVVMDKMDGASCFTGDTQVHLANGETMPIQEIVEQGLSPYVLSWSSQDGLVPKQVVLTHNNGQKANWVRLTLEDGSTITCTDDHLFHVIGKGWVKASELLGDDVTDLSDGGI